MGATAVPGKPQTVLGGGGGGGPRESRFGGEGGGPPGRARQVYRTGMWLAVLAISMLFVAFTSALIVRRGLSDDWQPLQLPSLIWWNTGILLLSSVALEKGRRALRGGFREACNRWVTLAVGLGVAFLALQVQVWRLLAAQGVYIDTNPSSSFFYLLTATHGVHLLGGVAALVYVAVEAWRYRLGPAKRTVVEVTAIYWHFMDGLWIYLLLLLSLWR